MFKFRASSILANIDWVDHVVADVSTHVPATVNPKLTTGEQKMNANSSLQDYFINMMKSRGYSGSTHFTLTCGYNNKPSVSHLCDYFPKYDRMCTSYLTRIVPPFNVSTATPNIQLWSRFHESHPFLQPAASQNVPLRSRTESQRMQQIR
jgi:hypothetical protein